MDTRKYGWQPDLPDHRDHMFKLVYKDTKPTVFPTSASVQDIQPPIFDQGPLGSCVFNSAGRALGSLVIRDKMPYNPFSRLYMYYNTRVNEGTVGVDSGAQVRDAIKAIADQGACYESEWAYDVDKFAQKPDDACYTNALPHRAISYQRLTTLDDMRQCLVDGFPFIFGITVYESFESDQVARTGIVPMPGTDESALGGHCISGISYDDSKKALLCANSWGENWGMKGYFELPYPYLESLADDFWTIRKTYSE